jgi:Mor family transcriptional regulator
MEIYVQYKGGNSRELAERFGLTQQQICSIVARQHGLHRKRVQPGLFE